MVTADVNREGRLSSAADSEEEEKNNRIFQARLDRLYLEQKQFNTQTHPTYYSESPAGYRDMYMPSNNTVPVYRHGRKFYVPIEEYERMRTEERRQRRNQVHRAQNLPLPKSHATPIRSVSTSYYNPIHRSVSNPQDYRQGVTRSFNINPNSGIQQNNSYRSSASRPSRSNFKYEDEREESNQPSTNVPIKLPTTTVRSNSSDKVLDLRRTPQPTQTSFNDYVVDDYSIRRSLSAEMVPDSLVSEQRSTPTHRQIPFSTYDYDDTNANLHSHTLADSHFNQLNSTNFTNYTNQIQTSTFDTARKPFSSERIIRSPGFEMNSQNPEHAYIVRSPLHRRNENMSPVRTSTSPNHNQYYDRDPNVGSYSDDNSSSPSTFNQRRNTERNRYRRPELVVETDDDYDIHNPVFSRPTTMRSQSNDRLTEKKRVRFADMEGFTLETSSDREFQQQQRAMDYRPYTGPTNTDRLNDLRRIHPSYPSSIYPINNRLGHLIESKLATDV